jgi:hypothetical protein
MGAEGYDEDIPSFFEGVPLLNDNFNRRRASGSQSEALIGQPFLESCCSEEVLITLSSLRNVLIRVSNRLATYLAVQLHTPSRHRHQV